MHVFQPYPIKELEFNPFTLMGKTGACITADCGDRVRTMVSSEVGFGKLWDKDVAFVLARENSYTKEILDASELFSISFFEETYLTSMKIIKSVSGRQEDTIAQSGFHINKHLDIPFIDEAHLLVLCAKMARFQTDEDNSYLQNYIKSKFYAEGDLHSVYVGEILEVLAR